MKKSISTKLLSVFLAMAMAFIALAVPVAAASGDNSGKYVKDVFVATGEKKEDAEAWLRNNGWEPICDFNDGKSSKASGKHNSVAVLGIRRTNDPKEAITDMATMYMTGYYSFDDYESLVKQKKADIDEFINFFVPALNEYRDNYNGKGSEGGQKRAQMAHDILNKFFDGDPNGEYAINDTGKPLGDLLLNKTKTEIGDNAYNALSKEQKLNTADLQQIILESSGPAVLIIEQTLALATDTSDDTWLDRLDGLTGDDLVDRIEEFAPESAGQDLAPSAAMSLLAAHFEDYSRILAEEWFEVRDDILWFEEYCEENELWQDDSEDDEDYAERIEAYFNALHEEDADRYNTEVNRFDSVSNYYFLIQDVDYSGEWGDTLFDFFRPEDEDADYSEEFDFFAPIAAALSAGQRAALEFLKLSTLLKLGLDSDDVMAAEFPKVGEMFKGEDGKELESISIYSGINRAIFRKGVALTSQTLMQKAMGKNPYDQMWDMGGIADIIAYTTFAVGAVSMVTGVINFSLSPNVVQNYLVDYMNWYPERWEAFEMIDNFRKTGCCQTSAGDSYMVTATRMNTAGRWLMGIGGALMLMAAALKGVQLYQYYHRTFSKIPTMIVDEADIVSYTTNKEGKTVTVTTFDQFAYYEAVKCNRQEVGLNPSAQGGVDDYKEWGCGDAADINGDVGKQWLALYVNRSEAKGDPILADSLSLKIGKGSEKTPDGYTGCLHMFMEENPVKIDNEEYCYRSDNKGMYLYWKTDANAYPAATASAFSGGVLALAGFGGLGLGALGTALIMLPKMKKKKEEEAA